MGRYARKSGVAGLFGERVGKEVRNVVCRKELRGRE